jgi:hypothetical protein
MNLILPAPSGEVLHENTIGADPIIMAGRKASMGMVDIRILGNIQVPQRITSPSQQLLHQQHPVHNQASPILSHQPHRADQNRISLENSHSQVNCAKGSLLSSPCGSDREVMDSKTEKETSESDRFVVFGGRLVVAWIAVGFEGRS